MCIFFRYIMVKQINKTLLLFNIIMAKCRKSKRRINVLLHVVKHHFSEVHSSSWYYSFKIGFSKETISIYPVSGYTSKKMMPRYMMFNR